MPCARQPITRDANEVILCRQTFIRRVSLFLPAPPLSSVACVPCASLLRPSSPPPHGCSVAGWHRIGLGWLDGYCRCRCCWLQVLLFVPPLQRELK
ncbi:unnamed protein product [Macrosiphum euphorbiae]|uniref:Uncharacterized protein n=1 Tax=Macrosiphum euphorbiae TaxID=13131 RepID=A0AAV0VZJ1_9HEMI|nr:unnamed protein product [Macrosiphum euphorbiae]